MGHNPRLRYGVRYSYDLVYMSSTSLLSSTFVLLSPHPLTSLSSFSFVLFLSRAALRSGKPLHSSKAVGRAHDSTSNLEQGQPNAVDNVNWWAGSWESVVRTMPSRETMGKKQWAPISIYLNLWGLYRCCFFYFIFLFPFLLVFVVFIVWSFIAETTLQGRFVLMYLILIIYFVLSRQFDAVIIFTKECEIYSRFSLRWIATLHKTFAKLTKSTPFEPILIYAKPCCINYEE